LTPGLDRPHSAVEWSPLFDPAEFAAALERGRVRAAWVDFLAPLPWCHVAVLTPRFDISLSAVLAAVRPFARRLTRVAQGPVPWFAAAERGACGWPHIHTLFAGTEGLTQQRISHYWRLGHSSIRVFPGYRRIISYVVKRLGESPEAAELNAFHLPPDYRYR
jgi:hypothetical protein